jgi:predicted RNase H-like HicB family nuclease
VEKYTAIFERGEDGWWVASCLEIPEAITQGETIDEARENLKDAIQLVLEVRREGTRHSIYQNPHTGKLTSVPRHAEIDNTTARKICLQLGIPPPR